MLDRIEEALEELRNGKIIIVVDDEDRENEGDFICAGEFATPENINLMATRGRGLICMPMTEEYMKKLNLSPMCYENTDNHSTAFTVSIDHVDTTTGISAYERSLTTLKVLEENIKPEDFRRPGHMFPLIAKKGGVLKRNGHTEATVDLMRMAGLKEVGLCCEIMKDNGTMARLEDLEKLAKELNMKLVSIKDLQKYIKEYDRLLEVEVSAKIPTKYGEFDLVGFRNDLDDKEHIALVKGDIYGKEKILVRVHSECFTGDLLGSLRCECGNQLEMAMKEISKVREGVILYLRQEGRGIGLLNKLKAYNLQDQGRDTVEANLELGFEEDERDYAVASQMLKSLGVKSIRLLTNNPTKVEGLVKYGVKISERVEIEVGIKKDNLRYMKTKKEKMGHLLKSI